MKDNPFVDTNILVYAHDIDAGDKHGKAREIVMQLWQPDASPVISVQVLQEFHVALIRKKVSIRDAMETTRNYLSWKVIENDRELFCAAQETQSRYQLSFWDSMIIAAALRAGVRELWTEDLGNKQRFGSLRIINPLV